MEGPDTAMEGVKGWVRSKLLGEWLGEELLEEEWWRAWSDCVCSTHASAMETTKTILSTLSNFLSVY